MSRMAINRQPASFLSKVFNPVKIIAQNLSSPTSRLIPYTLMAAAALNCAAIGCAAIRLAWFDIQFFYLEFVRKDSVAAMTLVENCSLETNGVVLLLTYLFKDWPPRL